MIKSDASAMGRKQTFAECPFWVENGHLLGQAESMASVSETKVSLRFSGDDLDPRELTARLGGTPTSAAAKGGILRSARGTERVARTGQWHLRVEPAAPDEDFDSQVTRLFDQLHSDEDVWRYFSDRYAGNLFVGLFLEESNEGVLIRAETLMSIAARGLELGFDIYAPSDD